MSGWGNQGQGGHGGQQGWGGQGGQQGWGQQGQNQGWGQQGQQGQQNQGWGQQGQQGQQGGWGQQGQQGQQGGWGQQHQQGGWGQQGQGGQQNQGWGNQNQPGFIDSLFDQNRNYAISTVLDNDKVIDVSQGNNETKNKLILWHKSGDNNQKFKFKAYGGGRYQILPLSGGALQVTNNSSVNGEQLQAGQAAGNPA